MNEYLQKSKDHASNIITQKKAINNSVLAFIDNRTELIQKKSNENSNNSFQNEASNNTIQLTNEKSKWNMAKKGAHEGFIEGAKIGGYASILDSLIHGNPVTLMETLTMSTVGAITGGITEGLIGFYSGYKTYSNGHADQYADELRTYQTWLDGLQEGLSDYDSGVFFMNPHNIHGMLQQGKVMYVYDVNANLKVSGNHDAIKHAILAGNEDVYAAGTADIYDDDKNKIEEAISWAHTRDENLQNIESFGPQDKFKGFVVQSQREIQKSGFDAHISIADLVRIHERFVITKNNCVLNVTEDSGHYHPGYESGHAAFEAWKSIGYSKIRWLPRWTKKEWYQQNVQDSE